MRPFLSFCLALVVFLSWVHLAVATDSSSDEGPGNGYADEDELASRSSRRGHFISTDNAVHLRDSQLLHPHHAPPPKRLSMPHPALGMLRPAASRHGGSKVKAEPSSSQFAQSSNRPQPHPALPAMRLQEAERALIRGRVRRIMDENGETSGFSEPHSTPMRQRGTQRRIRRMRYLRDLETGDEAERTERTENGHTSMPRGRERHRQPDRRTFFTDQLSSSPSPPSSAAEPLPPSSPLPSRNLFPTESLRAPHVPSSSIWISSRHHNNLNGVPVGEPGMASAALRSPLPPWDPLLARFFQSYTPTTRSPQGMYSVGGLRYGEIPSSPRLPDPPRQLPPGAGSARVLIPEEPLYRNSNADYRARVYAIALEDVHNPMIKMTSAQEAKRLYHEEAEEIRKRIDQKKELPLYTSEEWRQFVAEQGSEALLQHHVPRTINIGLDADIIQAEQRLANAIHPNSLQQQAVIPLRSRHEQIAANYLVTWWTASHEKILDEALVHAP
ncbi:uncharacterized protein UTRI_03321 [Ustilago trichophora]|uniref:Uncharacterized protein n=1 Tax=Ustilago trichophora TaxID=86804 RepID=A0A5C3E8P0_9BASI|nr:uncharacterized protein UTRI_03321 [Ustilago trichophora]